ncbi:hypothetical protein DEM26_19405, partial [Thioclava sp. NG1]|uniref:Ig-like domain-containing protein n=1 Tax=Thioclava sp. NG1 TaxID=2182426 RepID=UPI000D60E2C9
MSKAFSTKLVAFCASLLILLFSAFAVQAASLSGVSLVTDGQCGLNNSSDTFKANLGASGSEFPTTDETIVFSPTYSEPRDVMIFYVTDAANVVIGRHAEGFYPGLDFYGEIFFYVNKRPTVSGNFTLRMVDETDRTPDISLGASFSTSNRVLGSTSFNAAALDPDCVPAQTDTTPPQASSVTISSNNAMSTLAKTGDKVTLQMTFSENLAAAPSVTLLGQNATVTGSGASWAASAIVTASTPESAATFSISNYRDAASNAGTTVTSTTNNSSVLIDRTNPSASISSTVTGPTNTSPIPVSVSFSEAVSGFAASDLSVSGGSVSNFSGSGTSYSFDVTPSA